MLCCAVLLVPPGQEAADKIFASKQQKPLDKGKTTKGKTTGSKRR